MKANIKALLQPEGIAVVGASREEKGVGRGILRNLLFDNYQGRLFPVNPKAEHIMSMKSYADISDIEEAVDMAVIATPRKILPKIMQACAEKGVKAVVVISAGFKETDKEGEELEEKITRTARENDLALVGPNCLGVINTHPEHKMNATFADHHPGEGNISFISQSGAVGVYALEYAKHHHISFAKFASLGNKALTNENDLLRAFLEDEQTQVILAYLEDFEQPGEFFDLAAQNAVSGNPKALVVIKSGKSSSGKRAAASHTGALTESEAFMDDLFEQYGIMRVHDLEELFQSALAFAGQPRPSGQKMCILTNAGGPGIISADAAETAGLEIPELSDDLQEALKEELPATASFGNPIDLVGDAGAERYEKALEILVDSEETDLILVLCTPQLVTDMEAIAESIGKFAQKAREKEKLLLCAFADFEPKSRVFQILGDHKIPSYRFGVNAIKAGHAASQFYQLSAQPGEEIQSFEVNKEEVTQVLEKAKNRDNKFLTEAESYKVFEAYGFNIAPYRMLSNGQDLNEYAKDLRFPLAAKAMSPHIVHKSDAGAVVTGIGDKNQLRNVVEDLKNKVGEKEGEGILLQEMQKEGSEMILGARYEEGYGHLLMFGMGGIFVEILKDVTYRRAPIRPHDARNMLNSIQNRKILEGARGKPAANKEALEEYLLRLSQLVSDFPQIKEIDLNPVFAMEEKALLADARILVK